MAGYKFRRQVVIEPYIVDFVCLEARLIVEADGGQHLEQMEADLERSAFLESLGYKVIRFWNHEILTDIQTVLEHIYECLIETPSPQPSPSGRGSEEGFSGKSGSKQVLSRRNGSKQGPPSGRGD